MANTPKTERFGNFVLEIETAPGSGVYWAPMAFVKRSFKRTVQTSDTIIVNPDEPDAPADVERNAVSKSWEITGAGALAIDDVDKWESLIGFSMSVRITKRYPSADGGRVYVGNGIINDFSEDSDKKSEAGRTQASISIQSDGPQAILKNP